ncbi:hypothetical protein IIA79_06070 [bacterium]|nr:hypothetical protein [bacterium]
MAWRERRYSKWLLDHEESLRKRQDRMGRLVIFAAVLVAVAEALMPWERYTPDVPALLHIAVAAIALPVLYLMHLNDFRRKEQAFTLAMSDRGRRLLFLDPYLEPEEFAVQERLQGAQLLPLQRQIDTALRTGASQSLHNRLDYYYKALPYAVHEGDRMGCISFFHPKTFISWFIALGLSWLLFPAMLNLPLFGISIGTSQGLTLLPLLMVVYLIAARANSRFAYEVSLFNWLRLG